MSYTVNCIRCLKRKATIWGGHVTTPTTRKHVIAGWCKLHIAYTEKHWCPWYGWWVLQMGRAPRIPGTTRRDGR